MFSKAVYRRAIALCSAIVILFSQAGAMQVHAATGEKIPVSTIREYASDSHYKVPDTFLEALPDSGSISHDQLRRIAGANNVNAEFVQLFFDDRFVFKAGNDYTFVPVDEERRMNSYDWDNLKYKAGNEVQYVKDGERRAYKGIDVSKHQGDIDWERVKNDGVEFAFIRLGYRGYGTGKVMLDGYYEQNMKNAIAAGVKVGVYFYSQAISKAEAVEEAQVVLDNIEGYDLDYPVVFDIEGAPNSSARTYGLTPDQMANISIAFCDTIEDAGYKPMVYSYSKMLATQINMQKLEKYDVWLANYYKVPFYPYRFQILQYTSKGQVDGIKGGVDMNLSFVNY